MVKMTPAQKAAITRKRNRYLAEVEATKGPEARRRSEAAFKANDTRKARV